MSSNNVKQTPPSSQEHTNNTRIFKEKNQQNVNIFVNKIDGISIVWLVTILQSDCFLHLKIFLQKNLSNSGNTQNWSNWSCEHFNTFNGSIPSSRTTRFWNFWFFVATQNQDMISEVQLTIFSCIYRTPQKLHMKNCSRSSKKGFQDSKVFNWCPEEPLLVSRTLPQCWNSWITKSIFSAKIIWRIMQDD